MGGTLSMMASFIGAGLDVWSAVKSLGDNDAGLAKLYSGRALSQGASAIFTLMGSLSYGEGMLAAGGYQRAATLAGRLLIARAAVMFLGLAFSIITLALTVAIWYFTDNELEDWCDACAFAKKPSKSYRTVQEQQEGLSAALYQMEIINAEGKPIP